eukprot:Rhum_TRINITY_DN14967_c13_g3::Rhum_TRINITY_DN14967_c13_g3_i1::g.131489::m.131489
MLRSAGDQGSQRFSLSHSGTDVIVYSTDDAGTGTTEHFTNASDSGNTWHTPVTAVARPKSLDESVAGGGDGGVDGGVDDDDDGEQTVALESIGAGRESDFDDFDVTLPVHPAAAAGDSGGDGDKGGSDGDGRGCRDDDDGDSDDEKSHVLIEADQCASPFHAVMGSIVMRLSRPFVRKTDSVEVQTRKRSCVSVLLLAGLVFLPQLLLTVCLGAPKKSPVFVYICAFYAFVGAMLALQLFIKDSFELIRPVFALFVTFAAVPSGSHRRDSPHGSALFLQPLNLLAFLLLGGPCASWRGGKGLMALHAATAMGLHVFGWHTVRCDGLKEGTPDTECALAYLTSAYHVLVLDAGAYGCLSALLRSLEHAQIVSDAIVDNCLPRCIARDVRESVSSALKEATVVASHEAVCAHLRQQPELIGLHVGVHCGCHSGVSILFADICGFTNIARTLPAPVLVDSLQLIFQELDWLCVALHLEKIKTIGDCYMACANLNEDATACLAAASPSVAASLTPDLEATRKGACDALRLGHTLCQRRFKVGRQTVQFRVGVHTGTVVSGVIGLTKLCLDVWGHAVNVASRMESAGLKGVVNTTHATYKLTRGAFRFKMRKHVHVKGFDHALTTYIVDRPRNKFSGVGSLEKLRDEWARKTGIDLAEQAASQGDASSCATLSSVASDDGANTGNLSTSGGKDRDNLGAESLGPSVTSVVTVMRKSHTSSGLDRDRSGSNNPLVVGPSFFLPSLSTVSITSAPSDGYTTPTSRQGGDG